MTKSSGAGLITHPYSVSCFLINPSYLTDSYIGFTLKMESVSQITIFGLKMMVNSGLEVRNISLLHEGISKNIFSRPLFTIIFRPKIGISDRVQFEGKNDVWFSQVRHIKQLIANSWRKRIGHVTSLIPCKNSREHFTSAAQHQRRRFEALLYFVCKSLKFEHNTYIRFDISDWFVHCNTGHLCQLG